MGATQVVSEPLQGSSRTRRRRNQRRFAKFGGNGSPKPPYHHESGRGNFMRSKRKNRTTKSASFTQFQDEGSRRNKTSKVGSTRRVEVRGKDHAKSVERLHVVKYSKPRPKGRATLDITDSSDDAKPAQSKSEASPTPKPPSRCRYRPRGSRGGKRKRKKQARAEAKPAGWTLTGDTTAPCSGNITDTVPRSLTIDTDEGESIGISSSKAGDNKRKRTATKSPYFKSAKKLRTSDGTTSVSSIPFPPVSSPRFGLIQEEFHQDPFKLLVAVTLLNRTTGKQAIPVFYDLMEKYPGVDDLALAQESDVAQMIRRLGLYNTRARTLIRLAKAWRENPPERNRRHRKLHYPIKGDGLAVGPKEIIADEDEDERTGAWEIAHLPGVGPYAIDSWRIFCRDVCRLRALDWTGHGASGGDYEPEWKRVLPQDKELRAFLRWTWLKEGWSWEPNSGRRVRADTVLED